MLKYIGAKIWRQFRPVNMDAQCVKTVLGVVAATTITIRKLRRKKEKKSQKRKHKVWVKPYLTRRSTYGFYNTLCHELEQEDVTGFHNFMRMDSTLFKEVLDRIAPRIMRQTTFMRSPIEPALRLAITLRYLATGNSYLTLQYEFRVSNCTISRIVPETCNAIIEEFAGTYLKCPSTAEEWKAVAEGFSKRWNFHNCLGALDGKHVAIRAPSGSGSIYYNYKGFHSIVLMALVDSDYRFLYVDVGANGGLSDGGVFSDTPLCEAFEKNSIGVPASTPLPGDDQPLPYSVVADDAFSLRPWLMKPYPQRGMSMEQCVFNYRLSRARRVVENAFGILAHRFRFLLSPMPQKTENVETIVIATCVIHNILRARTPRSITGLADSVDQRTHAVIPGAWRDNNPLVGLQMQTNQACSRPAKAVRDYLCLYYNSPVGRVPWQDSMI